MDRNISLSILKPRGITADGEAWVFPKSGGGLSCSFEQGSLLGQSFSVGDFLVVELTNDADFACAVTWVFTEADGRYIGFKMGLLPHLRTRVAIPYTALDGNTLFLPRTPGKLKTVTQGRPINPALLTRFSIDTYNSPGDVRLTVHSIWIADAEPDYPVETKPMVDALGQKACVDWKGKTKDTAELCEFLRGEADRASNGRPAGRSQYGGWLEKRFEPTGFFGVEKNDGRWWLCDPDGYAFFSIGLDCVSVDGDANLNGITCLTADLPPKENVGWRGQNYFSWHAANLYRAFGREWYDKWARMTQRRMDEWGFNTIACWSDFNYISNYDNQRPFTFIFGGYPRTKKMIFRDFPDVFDPHFADYAQSYAEQLTPLAENKYLIGYFLSNEPQWAFVNNLNLARTLVESGERYYSTDRLIDFLRERYTDIDALNAAWNSALTAFDDLYAACDTRAFSEGAESDLTDFSAVMVHEYIRVPSEAVKKIDPNHLNLGIRYAWLSSKILLSGSEYFDIYSFNCYSADPHDSIEATLKTFAEASVSDKPLMIGEFHFGALDRGLDATGIQGVTTQTERGKAYRVYMHSAASHPNCVGVHYFLLNDQAYLGRFDGENYQIGLVDVCQKPYYEFTDAVTSTNTELYGVANGDMSPSREAVERIPALFF